MKIRAMRVAPDDLASAGVNSLTLSPMRFLVRATALLAYALSLVALLVWPALTLLLFLATFPFDRNRVFSNRFYRLLPAFWSRSFPFWRIRFEGSWPAGRAPHVIVANHQSFLDIFVLCNIQREWKWVAKKDLFRLPFFGWGFSLTGSIPFDRGDPASAVRVMARAQHYIEEGISVLFFPEGTRSQDGKLLPFKTGAFKLAIETGAPVLPIAISGTAQGMPKGGPWVRPTEIVVRLLDPVPTAGLTDRDVRRLRAEVRARIAGAIGQGLAAAPAQAESKPGRLVDADAPGVPGP